MSTRKIATYKSIDGGVDVREISRKDQDGLIGTKGVAKDDLVWSTANNFKVDVTDVHEDVLEYLDKTDPSFKISEVEVVDEPADAALTPAKSPRV